MLIVATQEHRVGGAAVDEDNVAFSMKDAANSPICVFQKACGALL
jgi:hypothetical protein